MDKPASIGDSWRRITKDAQLSTGSCELCYVTVEPSGDGSDVAVYDGENANGDEITTLVAATKTNPEFRPLRPVYCRRGLFIDIGSNVTAVFVQWREIGR
jgi:hypothetical protein